MADTLLLPVVAAAILDGEGRCLVQRRPVDKEHGGLWEFPGGKVEPGESPEAALAREIAEELQVTIDAPVPLAFASEARGPRHLLLLLYRVERWTGTPRPLAGSILRWCRPAELPGLAMPPADRPLADALIAGSGKNAAHG
ncbi:(deoxy)nucleoside triphosphate pyrophosphohydrolase [Sphingomonas aracearum]|uniref:8-oxo-dGTP diphosphatase n=1 Tax=Sphingomonas aracearum TaxID=2283317 RepID=A0A369VX96_9SPHN|nr:(deoxy)nucleoside triphosphate pyrophosphohydrolase [Sphingomonas aracearum]RDE06459.1 (deoxy)nucleoside triphosphate pyrophosphohydrolase [Sphingomonas aracearum]